MTRTGETTPVARVWPGVGAFFPESQPILSSKGSDTKPPPSPLSRGFSFDWSKGSAKKSEQRDQSTPFLLAWGTYGDGLPFSSRQRWKHFVALLLLSALMFVLAGAFLPLVLIRPQKFCFFFTIGSLLSMASFAVLRGPLEQLKHMFSLQRLPFTSTYVGSMVFTLYAAMVLQSYVLVLLFTMLQAGALGWYLLSYIPGGAPILRTLTRGAARTCNALCCSSSGSSTSSNILRSWSGGSATSLLPL